MNENKIEMELGIWNEHVQTASIRCWMRMHYKPNSARFGLLTICACVDKTIKHSK